LQQLDQHCQSSAQQVMELLNRQDQLVHERQLLTEEMHNLRVRVRPRLAATQKRAELSVQVLCVADVGMTLTANAFSVSTVELCVHLFPPSVPSREERSYRNSVRTAISSALDGVNPITPTERHRRGFTQKP
ncbi:serologically defined colon cancer antigen 8, partial [Clarias magur]